LVERKRLFVTIFVEKWWLQRVTRTTGIGVGWSVDMRISSRELWME